MAKQMISDELKKYLESFVPPRPAEMEAMEAYASQTGFPIIGPSAGYLCYQISRMTNARLVFELGSGYGYSAAWFAWAVKENGGGTVHFVDRDEGLAQRARGHLGALGYEDIVEFHVAEALATLRETPGPFDLIFVDMGKENYPDAVPVVKQKLRSGGVLIADNVLWGGRVLDDSNEEPSTTAIRTFTRLVRDDSVWIPTVVPVHDGLLIAYRR